MHSLEGLNDAQRLAAATTEGPVLILAGAGAGKTKTIVHRILHLIERGTPPEAILAVTFTNKAASEMRERVVLAIGHLAPKNPLIHSYPFVATFHSLGVFLLRRFGVFEDRIKRFSILDSNDSVGLIKEAMKNLSIDPKVHDPRRIQGLISRSSNSFLRAEDLAGENNPFYRLVATVWDHYQKMKEKNRVLDFDDLLLESVALLENNPEARSWCQDTWRYIHIDEYQDTNEPQYRLANLLAGRHKNICVVGDADQSIYSWRGANIKNILEFEHAYPEATVITLEENYRSTEAIIRSANTLIEKNVYRKPKKLFTSQKGGAPISLYQAYDEADEAQFIADTAAEKIAEGIPAKEIAVLYRTNFQSRILEEAFLDAGVPYQVLGVRFFERREVRDVLSYLRASITPSSLMDIRRAISTPPRGVGKASLAKLFAGGRGTLSGKTALAVDRFYRTLEAIREKIEKAPPSEVIKFTILESGLEHYYKEEPDAEERIENLRELVTLSLKYDAFEGIRGIEKLIEDAALDSDQDQLGRKDAEAHAVKLMTIHAAKGLEFRVVFIAGLEHGLFPHENSVKLTGADAEEERRLMYVALTRAREKLYLSRAASRTIYGMRDARLPSEFLFDIPEELVIEETRSNNQNFGTVYLS